MFAFTLDKKAEAVLASVESKCGLEKLTDSTWSLCRVLQISFKSVGESDRFHLVRFPNSVLPDFGLWYICKEVEAGGVGEGSFVLHLQTT